MPAIPLIAVAASTAGSMVMANKAKKDAAGAAAQSAQAAEAAKVNIPELQSQAQDIARQNAASSAALEAQYNPGAAALRQNSLTQLNQGLNPNLQVDTIANQIAAQAGQMPTGISYDSPLLRDAIAKATRDLAMGGQLSQDQRNLVMRGALAKSGSVTGGLNLGRDLGVRDLGISSLQLENQRLQNASQLGAQEAGMGQGNANLSLQAQLAGTNNLFNSANFLQQIDSGNFAKLLSAAQLGQNIAQPMSGLDPGSVANLAVGNSNIAANSAQQQAGIRANNAQQGNANTSKLIGTGLGLVQNYFANKTPSYSAPVGTHSTPTASYAPSSIQALSGTSFFK